MSEQSQPVTILLDLGTDSDDAELNRETTLLYKTLLKSDADSVEKLRNQSSAPGAKSAEALTLGAIALAVGVPVLEQLIPILYDWIKRRQSNEASVEVQIGDKSMVIPASSGKSEDEYIALAMKMIDALENKPASPSADGTEEAS